MVIRTAAYATGPTVIDVTGSVPGLGQDFAPDRRFLQWHRTMMAELKKKSEPSRTSFRDLFRVMVEGRYRLHLTLVRQAKPERWRALGAMVEPIIVCPCDDVLICHRRTLAKELASAFGGHYAGELEAPP